MTVKECYEAMGADYEGVLSRLRKDDRIQKFLLKLLDDKSYELLCTSIQQNNMEEAFRAAHTLKGISQNLSLTTLYHSSNELSDQLRDKKEYTKEAEILVEQLKQDYEKIISEIQKLS